jgi:hypothetical protein
MLFDKKKAATVILSKMGKDGRQTETDMAHEGGDYDEYTSYAEDMLAAIAAKSPLKLASCLKAFHEMVQEEDEEQDAGG